MIDLHCHLDGSLSPQLIRELAQQQEMSIPAADDKLKSLLTVDENCKNLTAYLAYFDLPLQLLQTEDALSLATYDVAKQACNDGVKYIEIRFAPSLHLQKGLTYQQVIAAVVQGMEQAETYLGIKGGIILCAMRHHSVDENLTMLKAGLEFLNAGVCGLDLAGDEINFPLKLQHDLFAYATKNNVPFTIHAGEIIGNHNEVIEAIELGALRIGHGISVADSKLAQKKCLENNIVIEMCPVSNLHTKAITFLDQHPILKLLEQKIKVTLNTDNRTVSDITLQEQFKLLQKEFSFNNQQLTQTYHNAIYGAFAKKSIKETLLCELL